MSTKRKFFISILLVVVTAAGMLFTESKAGGESGIIVKLELASNVEEVKALLAPYNEEHLNWLRINTRLDFVFLLTYSALFFFALKGLLERSDRFRRFSGMLFLALVPAILDVVENLFILRFLNHDFSTPYYDVYYWVVHLKWGLVAVFVLISLLYLIRIIAGKRVKTGKGQFGGSISV